MSKKDFFLYLIKLRFKFLIKSGSSADCLDDFERVYRLAFEHAFDIVCKTEKEVYKKN